MMMRPISSAVVVFACACAQGADFAVGKRYPAERSVYTDEATGREVVRLTTSSAEDIKIYQTHPSWTADGEWIVFHSDRAGSPQLFAVHEEAGDIVQLTDEKDISVGQVCLSRQRPELLTLVGRSIVLLRFDRLLERPGTATERSDRDAPVREETWDKEDSECLPRRQINRLRLRVGLHRDRSILDQDAVPVTGAEVLVDDDRAADHDGVADRGLVRGRHRQVVRSRAAGAIHHVKPVSLEDRPRELDDLAAHDDLLVSEPVFPLEDLRHGHTARGLLDGTGLDHHAATRANSRVIGSLPVRRATTGQWGMTAG